MTTRPARRPTRLVFGDAVSRVLTVYKVTDGKWVADKTDTFK